MKPSLFVTCLLLIHRANALDPDNGKCVSYGLCRVSGKGLPCSYSGPPKDFDSNYTAMLRELCPQLPGIKNDKVKTCCDVNQVQNLKHNMRIPTSFFQKCPSCLRNFINVFCVLTCHPAQSLFLKPLSQKLSPFISPDKDFAVADASRSIESSPNDPRSLSSNPIHNLEFHVTDLSLKSVYGACSGVTFLGGKVVYLMCGKAGKHCDYRKFFQFLGHNLQNPLGIDFIYHSAGDGGKVGILAERIDDNDGGDTSGKNGAKFAEKNEPKGEIVPVEIPTFPCDKPLPDGAGAACTCQDCPIACVDPLPALSPDPEDGWLPGGALPWKVLGMDGMIFVMTLVFVCFALCFGLALICRNRSSNGLLVTEDATKIMRGGPKGGDSTERFCVDVDGGIGEIERMRAYDICDGAQKNGVYRTGAAKITDKKDLGYITDARGFAILPHSSRFQRYMANRFRDWGLVCATYPTTILILGAVSCGLMSAGLTLMKVTTDPVQLWSAPNSRARMELAYFEEHFTPFYRIEQLIIVPTNQKPVMYDSKTYGPIFREELLIEALKLQSSISLLKFTNRSSSETIGLSDICFKPLSPVNNNCTTQSLFQYYQNEENLLREDFGKSPNAGILKHFDFCSRNPLSTDSANKPCLSLFGGPINPWFVLGGYKGEEYEQSSALVITFVVNNEPINQQKSELWEKEFVEYMKNYSNPLFTVSFQAQRSIQDEIDRESKSDVFTILISYFIMFVYITIALGHFRSLKTILVDSKISIGIAGVLIVLASVTSSLGTFSYIGVPATLIIMEVVPFLVLAVGIDNVFILVHQCRRTSRSPDKSIEQHIGDVLAIVGPSMLLTSLSESVAFFLGAFSNMPAVQIFSLYAGLAVLYDFCLQVTCFISFLALDCHRFEAQRNDVCCCLPPVQNSEENDEDDSGQKDYGILYNFTEKYYAPFLLHKWIRPIVMTIFAGWICVTVILASQIHVGLDQKVSVPHDSYVLRHFESMEGYLSVGPPVYFVLKIEDGHKDHQFKLENSHDKKLGIIRNIPLITNLNASDNITTTLDLTLPPHQNLLCSGSGCQKYSFANMIAWHSTYPNISYLSPLSDVSSWIDDYIAWSQPGTGCCRIKKYSSIPDNVTFCPSYSADSDNCVKCPMKTLDSRPVGPDFYNYLPFFLNDIPGPNCPKAGKAAYHHAVRIKGNPKRLETCHFMAYHTVLKTSTDFIRALRHSRILADNITGFLNNHLISGSSSDLTNTPFSSNHSKLSIDSKSDNARAQSSPKLEVFPYSPFHVFYEQYLLIVRDSLINLSACAAAIFFVHLALIHGFHNSFLLTVLALSAILAVTAGQLAFMRLVNIELNALSLVNLVMAIGIAVEFVSHTVRAFAVGAERIAKNRHAYLQHFPDSYRYNSRHLTRSKLRLLASHRALVDTGSSVFSGIALTKLLGICVLAFSKSRIFSLYYFRMYLGVVLLGTLQGLVFLPVILSYLGPVPEPEESLEDEERKAREQLASARQKREDDKSSHSASAQSYAPVSAGKKEGAVVASPPKKSPASDDGESKPRNFSSYDNHSLNVESHSTHEPANHSNKDVVVVAAKYSTNSGHRNQRPLNFSHF